MPVSLKEILEMDKIVAQEVKDLKAVSDIAKKGQKGLDQVTKAMNDSKKNLKDEED